GQVHADHHTANHHADEDHDHRLQQAAQRIDRIVHFLLEVLGHLEQHGVERAGFFADGGHLHHHVREDVDLLHRHVDWITDRHIVAHAQHGLFVHLVAGGASDDAQRFNQRHAGLEGHRGGAGETGDRAVVHDLADHRYLEDQSIHAVLHSGRPFVGHDEADDGTTYDEQDQPPPGDHESGGCNDQLRECRQIRAESAEYLFEL